ncbi:MAG TPA: hypothetical protein P5244_02650 [Syntrophales bacterium]|nr:hypothetical protein [Syntrophales bacterium]
MITQPDALAKHNRKQILAAKLKAYHAERLMRKGWPDDAAARRCGYCDAKTMRKAIRKYVKSHAPAATGNGAGPIIHP